MGADPSLLASSSGGSNNYTYTSAPNPSFPPIVKGSSFLLAWRLQNRKVLLIGGGLVASGRLYYLLEADAKVTVVSPRDRLHPETAYRIDVSNTDDVVYLDREYKGVEVEEGAAAAQDEAGTERDEMLGIRLEDYDMVLTAIDEVGLSRTICVACRSKRIPVNVADVPPECDFYFGSQLRRGPLQIMVSTSGRGPKIASLIRKRIEESLPEDVEQAIDSVGKLRSELRKRAPGTGGELGQRRMAWMIGVCDAWDLGELGAMTPEVRTRLLDEGWDEGGKVFGPEEMGVEVVPKPPAHETDENETQTPNPTQIRRKPLPKPSGHRSTLSLFLSTYTETLKVASIGFILGALVPTAVFVATATNGKKGRVGAWGKLIGGR